MNLHLQQNNSKLDGMDKFNNKNFTEAADEFSNLQRIYNKLRIKEFHEKRRAENDN